MSSPNVLQEFLVSLGYQVDKQSEDRVVDSVRNFAVKIAAAATGVVAATAAMVAGLKKVAEQAEQVYFSSQRTGAAVENINALAYAFKQVGGTAAQAQGAIEGVASFLRNSPGAANWLGSLGIATQDAQGRARDTVNVTEDVGRRLASMPFYRAKAYASVAGIDEPTLLLLRRGLGEFEQQYRSMLKAAGLDSQQAAADAHGFMVQIRELGAAVSILGQKIAAELTKRAGGDIARFRETLVANFGRIADVITGVVHVVLTMADGLMTLAAKAWQSASDLAGWFRGLDGWSKLAAGSIGVLIALIAAPTASLVAALALLWEDYSTWKEGGKSLIDWAAWEPGIKQAMAAIGELAKAVRDLGTAIVHDMGEAYHWLADHQPNFGSDSLREFIDLIRLATALLNGDFKTARVLMAKVMHDEAATDFNMTPQELRDRVVNGPLPNAYGPVSPEEQAYRAKGMAWLRSKLPTWLGGTPAGAETPAASVQANEGQAFDFWIKAGFTPEGAAAKVAAEERESGFDPTKPGDNGQAGGAFQWHKPRRDAILNATGIDVWTDRNPADQRLAMLAEMRLGLDKLAGNAFGRIAGATSASDAAGLDTVLVERPGDTAGETAVRSRMAERILAAQVAMRGPLAARPLGSGGFPHPAGQMLRTGNQPSVTQTNNITVTGVSDPQKAANHIQSAQTRANGDLIRNMLPAAY